MSRQIAIYVNYLDDPLGTHAYNFSLLHADGTPWVTNPASATAEHTASLVASVDKFYISMSPREGVTGNYSVRVEYYDAIDVIAPAIPTMALTGTTLPRVTGTAEPNSLITLWNSSSILGTAVVDITGHYTFEASTPLADGVYGVYATASDAAGNRSAGTSATNFVVGTIAPTINLNTYLGYPDNPVNIPLLFGTARPGSLVEIRSGLTVVGQAVAGTDGNWQLLMSSLADGGYNLAAVTPASTGVPEKSSGTVYVFRDGTAPASPTLSALLTVGDGHDYRVFGTAEANADIMVTNNGVAVGFTKANASGTWEITMRLTDGSHALKATATDAYQNKSAASAAFNLTVSSDDYSANILTTGSLAIGNSIKGALEAAGDKDWIKVNLEALTTYRFSLSGLQTGGGTLPWGDGYREILLRLWDPQANSGEGGYLYMNEVGGYSGDPTMSYAITRTGAYYLEASSSTKTGTYSVSALDFARDDFYGDRVNAGAVVLGATVKGGIQIEGDIDLFRFSLEAGKTYTMVLTPGTGASVNAFSTDITDAAQTMRAYGSSNGTGVITAGFTATTGGSYYLSVNGSYGNVGSTYSLSMVAATDDYLASKQTTGVLAVGATVSAKIDVAGDNDWFKLNLTAGTSYTFKLTDVGDSMGDLRMYDAAGTYFYIKATSTPTGNMAVWTPSVSGTYFIEAVGGSKAATYTMKAYVSEVDDHASTLVGATVIKVGAQVSGRIAIPSDSDWFKVSLKDGFGYTFTTQAQGTEWYGFGPLTLSLVNASGSQVAGGYGSNSSLSYLATADGDYYFQLSGNSSGTGNYTIDTTVSARDEYLGNASTTGTLTAGGVIKSAIDISGDQDWVKVELVSGESYKFELTGLKGQGGTLTYPSLYLSEAVGYGGQNGYEYGRGGDPLITYTPTKSGAFFLRVGSPDGSVGTYTLKMGNSTVGLADTTAPQVRHVFLPINKSAPGPGGDLEFHFDEKVVPGSGQVRLTLADGTVVETFDMATSTRVKMDSSSTYFKLDPTAVLAYDTAYKVELGVGAVKDLVGLPLAASTTYNFRTGLPQLNLQGTSGNDVFTNGIGYDRFDGGAGIDTVVFPTMAFKDYVLDNSYYDYYGEITVRVPGQPVYDTLTNIERLVFTDQAIAFDIFGTAGKVYRLYQAAFDRAPDLSGMGYWLSMVDKGTSLQEVANAFVNSAEFISAFGTGLSNSAFVTAVYTNVLHRQPDQAGLAFWNGALEAGTSRQDLLMMFSESSENKAAVIGAIDDGIGYLPYF